MTVGVKINRKIAVLAVLSFVFLFRTQVFASPLGEELQKLKQADIPTTIKELNLSGTPDSENGAPVVPSLPVDVRNDAKEITSPDGRYSVIMQLSPRGGMELLFRPKVGVKPIFVKEWGSGISAIWSPDSTKVLVTARENSTDQWCEVYERFNEDLRRKTQIQMQIPLRVQGAHHSHISGLYWSDDSKFVLVAGEVWGDEGSIKGYFVVEADTGRRICEVPEGETKNLKKWQKWWQENSPGLEKKTYSARQAGDIPPIAGTKLAGWIKVWRQVIPGFNLTFLKKGRTVPINPDIIRPYNGNTPQEKLRNQLYIYSPDSTKFLDIYVGMEIFENNGKTHAGWDIDSGVAIVYLKEGKYKRLIYGGPSSRFDGGLWIDNNTFIITGQGEYLADQKTIDGKVVNRWTYTATLKVYNLSKDSVTGYVGPEVEFESVKKVRDGFLSLQKKKFPRIDFGE